MSMVVDQTEIIQAMQQNIAALPRPERLPSGPAIENKPLVGGEINIRLALSPGMVTLIAAPITILSTMLLAWILVTTVALPLFGSEMIGGALVNTIGGIAASLPLFILMKKGASAIAQAAILGIALRCGTILMGLLIATAPAWGLTRMPLVYWTLAFYFPLLIVETGVVAWLSNKAKH